MECTKSPAYVPFLSYACELTHLQASDVGDHVCEQGIARQVEGHADALREQLHPF